MLRSAALAAAAASTSRRDAIADVHAHRGPSGQRGRLGKALADLRGGNPSGILVTHTFRACPAPPHTRTARPLHADTEKRPPYRPSWPAARVRSHGHGGLAAAAAQPPREANPLWPCGTPGRDGAEAAAKAAASPGSNPPPRGSRGAGSACPSRGRRGRSACARPGARTRRPSAAGTRTFTPTAQGLRSNVRTLTSTVRTLLGPTPALILLLAQCSNTCQRCCWHTVRTHICVRAEASDKIRAISSNFERFRAFFDIILAELCSQDVTNVF